MFDREVLERLGVYANQVEAATVHGWPIGLYEGGSAAQQAKAFVNMLIDAHMDPVLQADGETNEDYAERRATARETVETQLDADEEAFMAGGGEEPETLELKSERLFRFGRQAVIGAQARRLAELRMHEELSGRSYPSGRRLR